MLISWGIAIHTLKEALVQFWVMRFVITVSIKRTFALMLGIQILFRNELVSVFYSLPNNFETNVHHGQKYGEKYCIVQIRNETGVCIRLDDETLWHGNSSEDRIVY